MFWRSLSGALVCCIACGGKLENDNARSGSGGELANAGGSAATLGGSATAAGGSTAAASGSAATAGGTTAAGGAGQGFACENHRACGCKCCKEEPALECYYPDYGDSLASIIDEDVRSKSSPRCEEPIECGPDRLFVCCQSLPVEDASNARYTGSYSGPDSALVRIEKRDSDANCAEILLTRIGAAQRTLASNGIYFGGSGSFAPCGPTAKRESVLGISGSVNRRLSGSICVVDVHLTVFYEHNGLGGGVHPVRFDADGLDVGLSPNDCAF